LTLAPLPTHGNVAGLRQAGPLVKFITGGTVIGDEDIGASGFLPLPKLRAGVWPTIKECWPAIKRTNGAAGTRFEKSWNEIAGEAIERMLAPT
jgi:hypothetical protein